MKTPLPLIAALILVGCGNTETRNTASGTFEVTETTVSAEESGRLLALDIAEGQELTMGQTAGLVDTMPLHLRLQQLRAVRQVYGAQRPDVTAQLAALRQQLAKARQEQRRYTELVADGAAPRKLLDDANSQVLVLERQIAAQASALGTQTATLARQQQTTDTEEAQLRDRIARCHITAPLQGTVLEKYAERGEVTTAGKPLFKMADTRRMTLRAYLTSAQLAAVKLGQKVTVTTDYGDQKPRRYAGTVTWISDKSEFTPKTILTDDERADLVYAVKVAVRNDGYVKIGMYGHVELTPKP